jgi:hypothetical protein
MLQLLLQTRWLTSDLMMSSTAMIGAGVKLTVADSDELLRKGTTKLAILRLPLDAILLPEDQGEEALLPDYSLELGMTSYGGQPKKLQRRSSVTMRDRERVRDRGVAAEVTRVRAMLPKFL